MITQDALARAIDSLGATDLGNGRYAYRDEGMQRYYVVTPDALSLLSSYLDRAAELGPSEQYSDGLTCANAYSLWCADTQAAEMPSWWTPTQQFAWRLAPIGRGLNITSADCAERYPSDVAAAREAEFIGGARIQRITVNLETGEEVSA